ncbi:MAG: hypothetical protein ACAH83_05295 [Alphaproteobacteria bacterium]
MEDEDPQTEALRKHLREELGEAQAQQKKRMSALSILFTTLCLLTPVAVYMIFVYKSHDFHNSDEFLRWLKTCFSSKCS